jgi:hypothetical protein
LITAIQKQQNPFQSVSQHNLKKKKHKIQHIKVLKPVPGQAPEEKSIQRSTEGNARLHAQHA